MKIKKSGKKEKIDLRTAKRVLNKTEIKKIKKIKDKKEKSEALKYLLSSKLHLRHHDLEHKINKLKKKNKDHFFEELELMKIPYKIKLFKAGFNEDFKIILENIIKLESELKNA